jgi:hypothetical protein
MIMIGGISVIPRESIESTSVAKRIAIAARQATVTAMISCITRTNRAPESGTEHKSVPLRFDDYL